MLKCSLPWLIVYFGLFNTEKREWSISEVCTFEIASHWLTHGWVQSWPRRQPMIARDSDDVILGFGFTRWLVDSWSRTVHYLQSSFPLSRRYISQFCRVTHIVFLWNQSLHNDIESWREFYTYHITWYLYILQYI